MPLGWRRFCGCNRLEGRRRNFWAWNSTFPPSSQSMARPMIREREKSPPKRFHTDKRTRRGERVRTERENNSGALIKRNINQRDDMAMYKALHLLLSRDASCFPSCGALSLPHPRANRISTGAFAHVGVLYAFLHVRLDFLSRRCEFFSLRRTPFFLSPPNGRSSDNEKKTSRRMKMS